MGFKSTCRWIGERRERFASWVATHPPPSFGQDRVMGLDGLGIGVQISLGSNPGSVRKVQPSTMYLTSLTAVSPGVNGSWITSVHLVLRGLHKRMCLKHLVPCLAHSECSTYQRIVNKLRLPPLPPLAQVIEPLLLSILLWHENSRTEFPTMCTQNTTCLRCSKLKGFPGEKNLENFAYSNPPS